MVSRNIQLIKSVEPQSTIRFLNDIDDLNISKGDTGVTTTRERVKLDEDGRTVRLPKNTAVLIIKGSPYAVERHEKVRNAVKKGLNILEKGAIASRNVGKKVGKTAKSQLDKHIATADERFKDDFGYSESEIEGFKPVSFREETPKKSRKIKKTSRKNDDLNLGDDIDLDKEFSLEDLDEEFKLD